MDTRSFVRLFIATALLCGLGGCASISKSECLNANWEDVGIRDGANGRAEEYLIQHSTACAKVAVTPDREAWLAGRERGLERFCVPHRAYQLGEYGSGFDAGICRNFDQDRLQDAYEKGRDVNRFASRLGSIDTEIRGIQATLEKKDVEQKERERLAYRLGQLTSERYVVQRDYENARYRARDL